MNQLEEPINVEMQNETNEPNSDTSDDEEIGDIIKNSKIVKREVGADMDTESIMSTSTYKTKNEIDKNDIEQILKFMPKMIDKEIETINILGVVQNFIPPHTLFVKKDELSKEILDLDNFVWNESKELIGYIDEVVGPINEPYYTVMLYPAYIEKWEKDEIDFQSLYKTKQVFFVEKTKKLVFWNNLINQRGCDASNMHDEEIIEPSEQDFSDDEQEKVYKKIVKKVKNQRKRKRQDPPTMPGASQYQPQQFSQYKKRDMKVGAMPSYQMQPPYPYAPPMNYGQNMQPENPEIYAPYPLPQSHMLPSGQVPPPMQHPYPYNPPYGYPPYNSQP